MTTTQLHLFAHPSDDLGFAKDRAMGRRDGKLCCLGVAEETEWRQSIGQDYEAERAAVVEQYVRSRNMIFAEYALAEADARNAAAEQHDGRRILSALRTDLIQGRASSQRMVEGGFHVVDFFNKYPSSSAYSKELEGKVRDAERSLKHWRHLEELAALRCQKSHALLEAATKAFDETKRKLIVKRDERYRQYDLGYRETHPHRPSWM